MLRNPRAQGSSLLSYHEGILGNHPKHSISRYFPTTINYSTHLKQWDFHKQRQKHRKAKRRKPRNLVPRKPWRTWYQRVLEIPCAAPMQPNWYFLMVTTFMPGLSRARAKSLHAPPHSSSHWPASLTHQYRVCIWLQTTHGKGIFHPMASSGIPPARALLLRVTGSIKTSSRQTLSVENKVQPSTLQFSKRAISYQFPDFKRLSLK